ncbi:MAG: hypothetical protein ACOY0T_40890 [Myxococcota bacterium]
MRRCAASVLGSAAVVVALLGASSARADLGEDASRLTRTWGEHGIVRRLPPRLGERGVPSVIFLPIELLSGPASSCVSVAVLGPHSTHFTLRAAGSAYLPDSSEDWPQASLAGLVQITRCGSRKSRLSALVVEMRSPRALIEVIAVESQQPVQPAVEILPQRDPGPIAPFTGLSLPNTPPPLPERLAAAEANARRNGSEEIEREFAMSSARGAGLVRRQVDAGCHRLDVLVEPTPNRAALGDLAVMPELDATASLVSVERGDGHGAAFTFCAGDRTQVAFRFAGAPPESRVWVVASRFALPQGLLDNWGSGGKARMAAVLYRHGVRVSNAPVDQALGVQGPTLMPVAVVPGNCYVAAVTAVQGQAFGIALAARVGGAEVQNHGGSSGDGTLISFCARGHDIVTVEADSRGAGLTWLFALWEASRLPLGEELRL